MINQTLLKENKRMILTKDKNIFVETWTESKIIDLNILIKEKEYLEKELNNPEPTEEQLIMLGRIKHEEDSSKIYNENRILKINEVLKKYG